MHKLSKCFGVHLAVAAVTLAALTACAPTPKITQWTDTPEPATEPLFASDEEALAAVEESYSNYLAVSNQIAQDGGAGVERLSPLASESVYKQEVEGYKKFQTNGWVGVGGVNFDSLRLQQWDESGGLATITVYLCTDASNARLLDAQANDVTPPDRATRTPMQATFVSAPAAPRKLLLEESDVWSGDNFC